MSRYSEDSFDITNMSFFKHSDNYSYISYYVDSFKI